MKKIYLIIIGLVLVTAGTGCLGSTEQDIVGVWQIAPNTQASPWIHPIIMTINADGTVNVTDPVTTNTDDGVWSLTPNLANHRLTISGIAQAPTHQLNWNAEWHIIHVSANALIIAAKGGDFGGVTQFDFVRL